MSSTLDRVLTFSHNTSTAASLPLELQQHIYRRLDNHSFHAARRVCRWWRYASFDAVTLSGHLAKLPILPPVEANETTPVDGQRLFNEAAHLNMLGFHVSRRRQSTASNAAEELIKLFADGQRSVKIGNDNYTAVLTLRKVGVFDTSTQPPTKLAERPMQMSNGRAANGPWQSTTLVSSKELALSSDGRLLAVAQERSIQIYDLLAEPSENDKLDEYITSTGSHYISGLSFEQADYLLKVKLSSKGRVLYLGSPKPDQSTAKATLAHWRSGSGLKHIFLDTSLLALRTPDGMSSDSTARLSGLQLLRPFQGGFLFAAQKHGGSDKSHYIVGHVAHHHHHQSAIASSPLPPPTLDPRSVTELSRLESLLSGWSYILNCHSPDHDLGLAENMPSAHEHHPSFALSEDGSLLALAERDKQSVGPMAIARLFVYRLPKLAAMARLLEEKKSVRQRRWDTLAGFLEKLEGRTQGGDEPTTGKRKHNVARLPMCLSTVQGEVLGLAFEGERCEQDGEAAYSLTLGIEGKSTSWTLVDL